MNDLLDITPIGYIAIILLVCVSLSFGALDFKYSKVTKERDTYLTQINALKAESDVFKQKVNDANQQIAKIQLANKKESISLSKIKVPKSCEDAVHFANEWAISYGETGQ